MLSYLKCKLGKLHLAALVMKEILQSCLQTITIFINPFIAE